jgi:hypothetical protein
MEFKEGEIVTSEASGGVYKFIKNVGKTKILIYIPTNEMHDFETIVFRTATSEEISNAIAERIKNGYSNKG